MEKEALVKEKRISEEIKTGEIEGKYLTFYTDKQLFAVPIADVVQIVGMQEITQIPEYPSDAKGIINLRGSIIPVVDIRLRMGKMEADYDDHTCIIITNFQEQYFGFIVDEVDEVADIDDGQISPPPTLSGNATSQYLTGVARLENKIVLLINTARMLGNDELDFLASFAQ